MITGPDHPKFGQAKNSWLTGTAAWSYYAMTNWILGIRPEYNGLTIDPCIPTSWKSFTIKRVFRGTTYHITVSNPTHISHGVKEVYIDKELAKRNLIPIFSDQKEHIITIIMGK